ncbi:MAG: DUF192 domain-containing protein [Actinobacteria bacterium]|nr:DUF192 domain-containing protein [Actinomycetota bacterium]MCL6104593.1 DUF192 domain-containing protein [Actinomycetota bacterium]
MAWLLRNGEVLASLDIASSLFEKSKGLLGLREYNGALLLLHTRSVHSIGMHFEIDVAFCQKGEYITVVSITHMPPYRISLPRFGANCVLEAEVGAFSRWGLQRGDILEIRETVETNT